MFLRSDDVQRPESVPGPAGPAGGRRQGVGERPAVGQGGREQRERGDQRGGKAARASDHHQGQAARDAQGSVRGHAETHAPHPGAAGPGDRAQHAGHPGTRRRATGD